jgi:hypothetical protein
MKFIPIKDVSFDNTTTLAMGEAFDHACVSLHRFGTLITARGSQSELSKPPKMASAIQPASVSKH